MQAFFICITSNPLYHYRTAYPLFALLRVAIGRHL